MGTKTVHVAIYEGLADWEIGHVTAAINDPRFHAEPGRWRTRTVGLDDEAVRTMGGLRLVPDLWLDELDPADSELLILPGAAGWNDGAVDPHRWAATARRFLDAGVPVAAICGATYGLADAGLLDDRIHTSSARQYLEAAPGYRGAPYFLQTDATTDRGVITAGTTHGVAFAREILRTLGVFSAPVLDAWAALHTTHAPEHYFALMQAAEAQRTPIAA